MKHPTFSAVLLIVAVAAPARAEVVLPGATSNPIPTLTIRTYAAHDPDQPEGATTALAAALLANAGIGSRWVACGTKVADDRCAQPTTPDELAMRLLRTVTTGTSGPQAMGSSLVDTTRRTGTFATLYLDRIDALARESGTSSAVIFARALAHEAAHLVLGTSDHGPTGLMRPLWTRDMLRHDNADTWTFTADEAQRMRKALADRGGAVRPSPEPNNVTH